MSLFGPVKVALPETYTVRDLLARDLPPVCWVVEGLIAEGLTLLGAKPKKGKSALMLQIGMSVAQGAEALRRWGA